jgi:hypothetical protein
MDDSDADDGHVIISLDAWTTVGVEELEHALSTQPGSFPSFWYRLGTVTFDEPNWEARADKLNAAILELVDGLRFVPPAVLRTLGR